MADREASERATDGPRWGGEEPPHTDERAGADAPERREGAPPPTPFSQQVGRVVLAIAAMLFGIFAFANLQPVEFSWIFGGTQPTYTTAGDHIGGGVPLIVLLLVSFALGTLVGLAIAWRRDRTRRRVGR